MKVTKPGTVEVSEGKIVINRFDFESDGKGSYYEAAKAACEWAKAEMDRQLEELFEPEPPKNKTVHLNSITVHLNSTLDIVEGCYQFDQALTYIFANPIVCDAKPIEDKTPYYRKFERNRK
jgi:hypothetical protein